jgi:hypothetical protein
MAGSRQAHNQLQHPHLGGEQLISVGGVGDEGLMTAHGDQVGSQHHIAALNELSTCIMQTRQQQQQQS